MYLRYLNANPHLRSRYTKLKNAPEELSVSCSDAGFEAVSALYLKVSPPLPTLTHLLLFSCSTT